MAEQTRSRAKAALYKPALPPQGTATAPPTAAGGAPPRRAETMAGGVSWPQHGRVDAPTHGTRAPLHGSGVDVNVSTTSAWTGREQQQLTPSRTSGQVVDARATVQARVPIASPARSAIAATREAHTALSGGPRVQQGAVTSRLSPRRRAPSDDGASSVVIVARQTLSESHAAHAAAHSDYNDDDTVGADGRDADGHTPRRVVPRPSPLPSGPGDILPRTFVVGGVVGGDSTARVNRAFERYATGTASAAATTTTTTTTPTRAFGRSAADASTAAGTAATASSMTARHPRQTATSAQVNKQGADHRDVLSVTDTIESQQSQTSFAQR
jgi:hypothetical protein